MTARVGVSPGNARVGVKLMARTKVHAINRLLTIRLREAPNLYFDSVSVFRALVGRRVPPIPPFPPHLDGAPSLELSNKLGRKPVTGFLSAYYSLRRWPDSVGCIWSGTVQ